MAKKKPTTTGRPAAKPASAPQVATDAHVKSAAEQVSNAREQLRAAEALLEEAKEKAVQRVAWLKDKSAGELIDTSLEFVRKHPGLGVVAAASVGFLFARLFRR